MHKISRLINTVLKPLGLNVTRYPPPHLISRHILDFVRSNKINLVIDVGAYHGAYCRMLRHEVGYEGWIASIEPCASSFEVLSRVMSNDSKWRGWQFGLSDCDAVST